MAQMAPGWRPRTADEFLAGAEHRDRRYEFAEGEVYRLAGVSQSHSRIQVNLASALVPALRHGPCRLHLGAMSVRVGEFVYLPDVMVACGPSGNDHVEQRPCLTVEIVSPSTERTDRREKAAVYQQVPTLESYVIIAQLERRVDVWRRNPDRSWTRDELRGNESVTFGCAGISMTLDEIYENVEFPLTEARLRLLMEEPVLI